MLNFIYFVEKSGLFFSKPVSGLKNGLPLRRNYEEVLLKK